MSLSAPTLFGNAPAQPKAEAPRIARSLADLMHDGFYLLFMLRNRAAPADAGVFRERIRRFLDEFERNAKRQNASADDIYDVKYAFCAAVDEAILGSRFSVRDEWERQPLQLALFGEQLAGEGFFEKLEQLRAQGARRVQALEVFHHCLLHGFRGKYLLEGPEKINYLIARVGDEVVHHKGKRAVFAPHWAIPDRIRHALRSEVPVWVIASVMGLMGVLGFIGLRAYLDHQTGKTLASYQELFKLAPRQARITITLP
ncbi:DotU family type IV/VI secretion system protein [Uliginosibacterium aquaticum]|uniref:DotU family type IV/VI secretion system protein n=1 Tax=Uliginosibacterium aquaticum TaxID=2731212 RepID=A0ABX2IKS0_9RHOO|nr:DotU family type IV/VI secretion system protein [Uliginosibacterium aquaticum]NSL57077.1 DotU family type IV/VI secretion system protein [Uliginosibacterium aquaticum]